MQIIDARAEDFADVFDRVVNARRESEQNAVSYTHLTLPTIYAV